MNRIILLEDRPSRPEKLLPNAKKDLIELHSLHGLYMPAIDECKEIIEAINQKKYNFDKDILMIVIHRSSLNANGMNYLYTVCKHKKLSLILYSGGTSSSIFRKDKFPLLNISSAEFYTSKLIPFLENKINDNDTHILELIYNNWQTNYIFQLRHYLKIKEGIMNYKQKLDENNELELEEVYDELQIIDSNINDLKKVLNWSDDLQQKTINQIIKKELLEI